MPDVRTIADEDVAAYLAAMSIGFHRRPTPGAAEFYGPFIEPGRTYAAFDGDDIVGTARSFPTQLSVPGGALVAAAGVTNVTVTATHRRRGLLTEMMRLQLDEIADRGEPVAVLIASEAPIYGRFGYGPGTEAVVLEVDATRATFSASCGPRGVRLATVAELRNAGPVIYAEFRRQQSGTIGRDDRWWDVELGVTPRPGRPAEEGEGFLILHRAEDGTADGFARYRIKDDWDYRVSRCLLEVDELVALTDEAYSDLWEHCISVDWIRQVKAYDRPPSEPLPWLLTDPRAARQRDRSDFLWVRLLDVPAALEARRYQVHDRLVIEVADAFRPDSGGRFLLDAGPDGARCRATTEAPDLTLNAAELGAAYLGSTPLWPALAAGRIIEHRHDAVAAFDLMFLTDRPAWSHTWF